MSSLKYLRGEKLIDLKDRSNDLRMKHNKIFGEFPDIENVTFNVIKKLNSLKSDNKKLSLNDLIASC